MRDVYWIGGGSGGGKSTVARALAPRSGLRVYATDDVMPDHARRCPPADCPCLARFAAMSMDERWLLRTPRTMFETFHWYRGEGFHLVEADLRGVGQPVVAEGFRLLPSLVRPLLTEPHRAVWLLPTPEFRRAAFEHRGSLWQIAGRTSDPERALANLLERDRMFTDRLRAETAELGLRVIEVDGSLTPDELTDAVAGALRL
ncbi:hypothetical protein KZZ52_47470 [Dactylosporangium sp. AC04546]|uniref:hypothetical protein n=1 Tax=Dactylosporangium sp. AC04546 TaxID=2862460 RepID=UPI001EDED411|nr:hypothetical protein [Dactylosporangium sp. AC04546]WVK81553.1 hypothetical protein KZZ52_47470 [Dactylosporangium sp. AC04546]